MNSLLGAIDCWLVIEWWLLEQEAHQEMRIANVTFLRRHGKRTSKYKKRGTTIASRHGKASNVMVIM